MSVRLAAFAALALTAAAPADAHPVTVRSCDRQVIVEKPPQRAVSYDSNMTEMMLALGLSDRMVGFMGPGARVRALAATYPEAKSLRHILSRYPTRETFLEERIDFYVAGWSYGMRAGGEITPDTLGRLGVGVYELTESCIRISRREKPTLDFLYRDLINFGRIFGVEDRAEALVAGYRTRIDAVAARLPKTNERPRVFVYDSPGRVAGTAGGYSMPTALIEAAGGLNIADDLVGNWTSFGWESVIDRDPDAMIVMDFGSSDPTQKLEYLRSRPGLRDLRALRENRILVLSYNELTPGPRNIEAVEKIAEFLHGER